MNKIILLLSALLIVACARPVSEKKSNEDDSRIDSIATAYVKLGLLVGQYDADFVDAYYGPDSLKPTAVKSPVFPKDSLLAAVNHMKGELDAIAGAASTDTLRQRASWISSQLTAFSRRIKIFSGELKPFDEESKELFGAVAPAYKEAHFKDLVKELDAILPQKPSATIADRFQELASQFIIPKAKVDTVFKTAIAEARKRTTAHYDLPGGEMFTLEYVTNKPWSGYNWYKGNYTSVIQMNLDLSIFVDRAIDLACHEGYPGHHVYNMLLEKNLYHDKNWVELSLYPLFSPQSLIAEGSANYGIELAFPGNEAEKFTREVLLPLGGMDTTGVSLYFRALAIRGKLNYARNEAARGILGGTMDEKESMRWLKDYCLFNTETAKKSIDFIRKYRSYVINYNYGKDLVKNYIEGEKAAYGDDRWKNFGWLLSNEVRPANLLP